MSYFLYFSGLVLVIYAANNWESGNLFIGMILGIGVALAYIGGRVAGSREDT